MKRSLIYIVLLLIPFTGFNQVYLSGVLSNPVIKDHIKNNEGYLYKSSIKEYQPVFLPFVDDFKPESIYPDTNLWIDNEVYINAEYPIYPVNYGVATFDVLDANGDLYSHANQYSFLADHLTSYPIRLDSVYDPDLGTMNEITPADSVYLSFYYQPQGYGDAPLPDDSLVLEFGMYSGDTIFSHYDYTWVYGYEYVNTEDDYVEPYSSIQPPLTCDTSLWYVITDTLFYNDSVYIPCDSVFIIETDWTLAWTALGDKLDTFLVHNDVYFKNVLIPITDTAWLKSDFQFRFSNYGSISDIASWQSNTDHWHIDKVYLNVGRSMNDIFTREVTFVEPAESFVKEYYSMPIWHYNLLNYYKEEFEIYANNNDSIDHSCKYYYQVEDEDGNILPDFNYTGTINTIEPFYTRDVTNYQPFAYPPIIHWFDFSNHNERVYKINHYIHDEDLISIGDTISNIQNFANYFAYDDGTAERSYGASVSGTRIAVQFRTTTVDTLRGVQIFFNKTYGQSSGRYFDIGVWNNNNGKPGLLIYEEENVPQQYDDLNNFHTYIFEDTIIRLGIDIYYIGVRQSSNENLNIGFDRNTNSRIRTFFNTSSIWEQSPYDGSLMLRPVVGRALTEPGPPVKSKPASIEIYPNPPGNIDFVTIDLPKEASDPKYWQYYTTRVFDVSGRLIYSAPFEETLNITGLDTGFYILDVLDEAFSRNYTTKLLIVK